MGRGGRICCLIAGVMILSWMSLSMATWVLLKKSRRIHQVEWLDPALPWRWPLVKRKLGEHYLAEAEVAAKRGDVGLALHLYRAGMSRTPDNYHGRLGIARIYASQGQVELAKEILVPENNRMPEQLDYLEVTLPLLLRHGFDGDLESACDGLLARPLPSESLRFVALHAAALALQRGDLAAAEAFLGKYRLEEKLEGQLLRVQLEFERGLPEVAILRLKSLTEADSVPDAIFALMDDLLRRMGADAARELNASRRISNDPLSFMPRIALLKLLAEKGDRTALDRESDRFLRQFRSDQHALLAFAEFGATTGRVAAVRESATLLCQQPLYATTAELLAAEALIVSGRHEEALNALDHQVKNAASSLEIGLIAREGLRLIALFALNRMDEAGLQMEQLMNRPGLRADSLHRIAVRLDALGQRQAAHKLLSRAVELDPRHQSALGELVRLDLTLRHYDTLFIRVPRLLASRRPDRGLLEDLANTLGSDRFLLRPEQVGLLRAIRSKLEEPLRPCPAPPQAS